MKRQRSRNRGSGGGGGGGGGGKPQHNANRAFDSNGPDNVKIRGNAQHVFEKYQQLARDAASSGDRVLGENYLQHAEHYFRVLRAVQPQRPASEIIGRDAFTSGIDIDFEDENGGEAMQGEEAEVQGGEESGEARGEQRPDQRGENGRQDYRGEYRGDRDRRPEYRQGERGEYRQDRDGRPQGDRGEGRVEGRQDRDRYEGRRDERPYNRDDRPARDDRPPRDDRQARDDRPPRDDRQGQGQGQGRDRDRGYNRDDRQGRYEGRPREGSDPLPVVEPEATPLPRAAAEDDAHTLRSQDGGFSPAPAFLQSRAEAPARDDGEAAPEPRKRRPRAPKAATAKDSTPSSDES